MVLALFRVDGLLCLPSPEEIIRHQTAMAVCEEMGYGEILQSLDKQLNSLQDLSQLYNMVSCHFTMSHESL